MTVVIQALPTARRLADPDKKRPPLDTVVLDEQAGTLTYRTTGVRAQEHSAPLPGRGPGAVAAVVRASFTVGTRSINQVRTQNSRLLFVGEDGRVLWHSRVYLLDLMDEVWPEQVWAPLATVRVSTSRERFPDPGAAERAYPGAASVQSKTFQGVGALLAGLALLLVLVAVVALVLALA